MIMSQLRDLGNIADAYLELGAGDGGGDGHPLPARGRPQPEHHVRHLSFPETRFSFPETRFYYFGANFKESSLHKILLCVSLFVNTG